MSAFCTVQYGYANTGNKIFISISQYIYIYINISVNHPLAVKSALLPVQIALPLLPLNNNVKSQINHTSLATACIGCLLYLKVKDYTEILHYNIDFTASAVADGYLNYSFTSIQPLP